MATSGRVPGLVERPLSPAPAGRHDRAAGGRSQARRRTRSKSGWLSAGQGISGVVRHNARLITRTYRGVHSCATYGFGAFSCWSATLAPCEDPLAGLAWRLPPRPRQSLSIGPCSSRGHHRNRRLIARKVLRPVPARRRFSCSISETAPRAAPGPMSGIDERVVAVRSLFSPPFPLAPLLPTLEVAGGTAVDMGRWSPPCAATDSRFRGGG